MLMVSVQRDLSVLSSTLSPSSALKIKIYKHSVTSVFLTSPFLSARVVYRGLVPSLL